MPVTVTHGKLFFSNLKLIKTSYLRSILSQKIFINSAILSVENKITNNIDFENVIKDFVQSNQGKLNFKSSINIFK